MPIKRIKYQDGFIPGGYSEKKKKKKKKEISSDEEADEKTFFQEMNRTPFDVPSKRVRLEKEVVEKTKNLENTKKNFLNFNQAILKTDPFF